MMNPFKKLVSDAKSPEEKAFHDRIQSKAWDISKKVITHKLSSEDIDSLESLYKEYFLKFPDSERQLSSEKRIIKLRNMI